MSHRCHITARDAKVDLLIGTGVAQWNKKLVFHEHGPGSIEFKSMGEHAFMIEPHMIYRCHKYAFSDIAGFRGIYIPNELSSKKALDLLRVLTVIKTRLVSGIYQNSQSFHFKWNRLIVILWVNTSALLLILVLILDLIGIKKNQCPLRIIIWLTLIFYIFKI